MRAVEQALENAARVAPGGVVRESVTPLPAPAEQPAVEQALAVPESGRLVSATAEEPDGVSALDGDARFESRPSTPAEQPVAEVVQAAEMSSSHVPAGMPGTSPEFSAAPLRGVLSRAALTPEDEVRLPRAVMRRSPRVRPDVKPFPRR